MRRLPFLTKSQRRALLVIEWVLLAGIVGYSIRNATRHQPPSRSSTKAGERREWYSKPAKSFTYAVEETPVETFPFDPNTADSTTLLRLGLSPRQVRSIYRYRAKHGRYHTPEDFEYLPGLTVEQWERLKGFIRIAPKYHYVEPPSRRAYKERSRENLAYTMEATKATEATERNTARESLPREETWKKAVKLSPGQTIDINTADTSQLKLIPGIASKRAASIVAYRKKLGGFLSVEQAMEAIEMPDTVLQYMTVSPVDIVKINVNRLSVQQLMKHPYLNFYQAKAIFEHRRNKGNIKSIEELKRFEAFRPTDIDRLRPYLSFE